MKNLILITLSLILAISTYSCKDDANEGDTILRITVQHLNDNLPYEGVEVIVELDGGDYSSFRFTDADGIAEFKDIPSGTYTVYSQFDNGFFIDFSEFTVIEGQTTEGVVLLLG